MTGFPSDIMHALGFANKADAGELPWSYVAAEHLLSICTSAGFFRHRGVPLLSATSRVISEPLTLALAPSVAR